MGGPFEERWLKGGFGFHPAARLTRCPGFVKNQGETELGGTRRWRFCCASWFGTAAGEDVPRSAHWRDTGRERL